MERKIHGQDAVAADCPLQKKERSQSRAQSPALPPPPATFRHGLASFSTLIGKTASRAVPLHHARKRVTRQEKKQGQIKVAVGKQAQGPPSPPPSLPPSQPAHMADDRHTRRQELGWLAGHAAAHWNGLSFSPSQSLPLSAGMWGR